MATRKPLLDITNITTHPITKWKKQDAPRMKKPNLQMISTKTELLAQESAHQLVPRPSLDYESLDRVHNYQI